MIAQGNEVFYGVYTAVEDSPERRQFVICSAHAASNMAHQGILQPNASDPVALVKSTDLIGRLLKAPVTPLETVVALPMLSISMFKGTGIVTSVPSDSPGESDSFWNATAVVNWATAVVRASLASSIFDDWRLPL